MSDHPAASLFPMLDDAAYQALKSDIAANGLRVPIAMFGGAVLDGRNRMRACRELGVEAVTVDIPLDVDPWLFVASLNLHRRHLEPHERGRIYKALLEQMGVKRGRGQNQGKLSASVAECAHDLGVPQRTFERHLAAADAYEQLDEPAKKAVDSGEPLSRVLSGGSSGPPTQTAGGVSVSDEYYTPAEVLDLVYRFFGEVDLDPSSNGHGKAANVDARAYYTESDDGLAKPWKGRVFCNPPYGRALPAWTEKAISEWMDGANVLLLIPANMSTNWMRKLDRFPRCYIHGRVRFRPGGDEGLATFHSVIVAMLQEEAFAEPMFHEVFRRLGPTWGGCVEPLIGQDVDLEASR